VRAPCIATVRGRTGRLWRSIARPIRRRFGMSDLFGTSGVRSRARRGMKKAGIEIAEFSAWCSDEIGNWLPALQVKLLRVVQEVSSSGGVEIMPIKVDIRVIAATNCNLGQAVRDGAFARLGITVGVLK